MTDHPPIIRLENLRKSFGASTVFEGLDLQIARGQITTVIGSSGCGKSVLLKHMIGLLKPDAGRVFFDGQDITPLSERKLVAVRRRLAYLFQGGALFDSMTVEQNLEFPLIQHERLSPAQRRQRAAEVLAMVGLDGLQDRYPENLSGGQKKRVALARALVLRPECMLYDEPTTGLDPVRSDLIGELILRLHRQAGMTSVVVTHDMALVRKLHGRVLMLSGGRFLADTTADRLDQAESETVLRFVQGRASREELEEIETGRLLNAAAR